MEEAYPTHEYMISGPVQLFWGEILDLGIMDYGFSEVWVLKGISIVTLHTTSWDTGTCSRSNVSAAERRPTSDKSTFRNLPPDNFECTLWITEPSGCLLKSGSLFWFLLLACAPGLYGKPFQKNRWLRLGAGDLQKNNQKKGNYAHLRKNLDWIVV